ncbi:MAG: ribosomal protein S18-alanine N-acetyltransferase [Acutalibacteraceae bacterium]|nr:ribosomal protein S18-alanine N-acetyltransferase [Acutalibacteraceae bacterium]
MIKEIGIEYTDNILQIENQSFTHPASEKNIKESLLNDKYKYIGFFKDEKLVGYGSVFIVANESYINNIAVLKDYRRKRIATDIVNKIIELSSECEFVTLEVRESNLSAIGLYKKLGFITTAVRKNYYNKPVENAIIMTKYMEKQK